VERVQMLADFGLVFLIFSVGMGLSLGRLQRLGFSLGLATVVGAIVLAVVARPLALALGLMASGSGNRESIQAGLALTPIGEFSFVIAQLGVTSGLVPASFQAVAVGASLGTALIAPVLMRRSDDITRRIESLEPKRFRALVESYHDWLAQLRARQGSSVLWRLTGWRLGQIAAHMLFVSALLLFWQPGYRLLARLIGEDFLFPGGLRILFWTVFGLLLTGPLLALWKNVEAITMILAEGTTRDRVHRERIQPWVRRGRRVFRFRCWNRPVDGIWRSRKSPCRRIPNLPVGPSVKLVSAGIQAARS
jgi:monovalent cation:H+ antiporter-2, CPA2 family